jgi:mono/diheme cytochrome c family protein
MQRPTRTAALAAVFVSTGLVFAGAADRPQKRVELSPVERGALAYRTHCAVCHGKSAQGDGPLADQLRFAPPDLTRIAKRNKGKFDPQSVQRIIDGRFPIRGHGGPEMPVWGDAFLEPREGYSRDGVRAKIVELTAYLETLQQK